MSDTVPFPVFMTPSPLVDVLPVTGFVSSYSRTVSTLFTFLPSNTPGECRRYSSRYFLSAVLAISYGRSIDGEYVCLL